MRLTIKTPLTTAAILTFAACASSGGGEDAPGALFFGATDSTASGNGLPFANDGGDVGDLEGQTATVLLPRTILNNAIGGAEQEVLEGQASFGPDDAVSLVVDGETLNFVEGVATRADGTTIEIQELFITLGTGVRLFQIFADGDFGGRIDQIEFAHFIVGAETNPDAIPLMPGTVLYTGGVRGRLFNEAGSAGASGELSGAIQLSVTFGDGTVSGDVFLNTDGPSINLGLAPTAITGNGFAGDLTIVSCTIGTCTSNSEIGGVFMGENAESIGGILDLDIGVTDSEGNTSDLVGNGGFIAFDQES